MAGLEDDESITCRSKSGQSFYRILSVTEPAEPVSNGHIFDDSELLEEERTCLADPDFYKKVHDAMQSYVLDEREALLETIVQMIITRHGGAGEALLFVISTLANESKVCLYTNLLLHRGASPSVTGHKMWTPLHFAVEHNFSDACRSLLDHFAVPDQEDDDGRTPLDLAINNNNDDMASLLLQHIPNTIVRGMFSSKGCVPAKFKLMELLHADMQKTCLSLLDSMTENIPKNKIRVFYSILEADENGHTPDNSSFNTQSKQILFSIACLENKPLAEHPVVKSLIKRKWTDFAGRDFRRNAVIHSLRYVALTVAAIMAVMTPDPGVYDDVWAYIRAGVEGISVLGVAFQLLQEFSEIRSNKLDYVKDAYNWIDLTSALSLLAVVPLRVLQLEAQWFLFSVGYLLTGIRLFKYAVVFRQTSIFVQILFRILTKDIAQFMVVFSLILVAFSGAFILGLRGENNMELIDETSSYWTILVTGVRTLFEAQPVVEYTGENGYRWYCSSLMVIYIFISCVVLLNLLIAQMTDSYQNIYEDVQGAVELTRAWIICRTSIDMPHLCSKNPRIDYYVEYEDLEDGDFGKTSAKSSSARSSSNRSDLAGVLQDVQTMLTKQELNLRTMKCQLAKQAHQLKVLRYGETTNEDVQNTTDTVFRD